MSNVSSGKAFLADVERSLNRSGLGEIIHRNVYFPKAGEDVAIPLDAPYVETEILPSGNYRAKVIQGDRRAEIRKGETEWDTNTAYFVSNKDEVYADIAIEW